MFSSVCDPLESTPKALYQKAFSLPLSVKQFECLSDRHMPLHFKKENKIAILEPATEDSCFLFSCFAHLQRSPLREVSVLYITRAIYICFLLGTICQSLSLIPALGG